MDPNKVLADDIHDKAHDSLENLMVAVHAELNRQHEKWGLQDHSFGDWYLCITEELGELSEAILKGRKQEAWTELVHVVALLTHLGERIERPIDHWANPTTSALTVEPYRKLCIGCGEWTAVSDLHLPHYCGNCGLKLLSQGESEMPASGA